MPAFIAWVLLSMVAGAWSYLLVGKSTHVLRALNNGINLKYV